jgi:hypothetical protein
MLALEVWGAPTSRPERDPANAQFVYQRFQRGIMHYDDATHQVHGLLIGDFVKMLLRGDAPPDLRAEAQGSALLDQYCPGATLWICRPTELPAGTDLTFAFEPGR